MIFRRFWIFCGNQDFHENGGIAKTPIIPKEYQWFWRVDCPENAKSTKVTEIHEFLHILCKHRLRRGNFHPRLWNIATDYVINGWIIQSDRYGKDFTLPTSGLFHPLYSYGGRSAEEVAHDLLNRGWKTDEPPDYDCHVCRLAPVAAPD